MIIRHGRQIYEEMYEVRKGLWAFFSWLCLSGADWLGRQTPVTWLWRCLQTSSVGTLISWMYPHSMWTSLCRLHTAGIKRVQKPDAQSIIDAERRMKKRSIADSVERIKKNPPKPLPVPPLKLNKPKDLPILPVTATSSPPTSPALSTTSPSRKLLPPTKSYIPVQPTTPKASNWKYSALPPAKPVVQHSATTNHLLSRKRSYESSSVQQNGIDGW